MAYMIYQQYTTAVKEAYRGRAEAVRHAAAAKSCREWLESLEINPTVRNTLVEQIRVLEEAFLDVTIEA